MTATFDVTGRALRCTAEILAGAHDSGLSLWAGVHTGEVEVRGNDIGGMSVTIAKRVCDLAGPGEVLASHGVEAPSLAPVSSSGIEAPQVEGRARDMAALCGGRGTVLSRFAE